MYKLNIPRERPCRKYLTAGLPGRSKTNIYHKVGSTDPAMGYKMTTKTSNGKSLKPRMRKNLIAQEIAFAKILAGNDAKQRHRAVRKLKIWLRARINGKNDFTEDEFTRIWTGLFYCMWMSDKFLVQEELAESLSQLVHCFEENKTTALSFIRIFNKTLMLEWPGLDQHRIDKFGMLVRRFLRQSLEYSRKKEWDSSVFLTLMNIYKSTVLSKNSYIGYMLHFIEIYLEEFAKVSRGKVSNAVVKTAMEPFVKLLCTTKDVRIIKALKAFFEHLMKQTDIGIEFEEKFKSWKEQGFPGPSPDALEPVEVDDNHETLSNRNEDEEEDDDEDDLSKKILDPRAGKVDVELPQIPVDPDCMINLFKRYLDFRDATVKGKKKLRFFINQFECLKRGRFPHKIKKDPILDQVPKKSKRKRLIEKSALELLRFEENIDEILESKNQNSENIDEFDDEEIEMEADLVNGIDEMEIEKSENAEKVTPYRKVKKLNKKKALAETVANGKNETDVQEKSETNVNGKMETEDLSSPKSGPESKTSGEKMEQVSKISSPKKRKSGSDWLVDELDPNSPEYHSIKLPKIIKLEKKIVPLDFDGNSESEITIAVNGQEKQEGGLPEQNENGDLHVFWSTAKNKLSKKNKSPRTSLVPNSFAESEKGEKRPGSRRISFALHKNMAQENEEYLEEVRNSPKIPWDGSKKPAQSALKTGLSPSPINPFYKLKKAQRVSFS